MKRLLALIFTISMICIATTPPDAAPGPARVVSDLPLGLPSFAGSDPAERSLVDFGEFLFESSLLSADQSVSCSSCHVAKFGFADSHPLAIGIGGQIGRRRAPPLFNLFNAKTLMLDGRADSLKDQIHIPLESPNEMAIDWERSLKLLEDC